MLENMQRKNTGKLQKWRRKELDFKGPTVTGINLRGYQEQL